MENPEIGTTIPSPSPFGPFTARQLLDRTVSIIGNAPGLFLGIAVLLLAVELAIAMVIGVSEFILHRAGTTILQGALFVLLILVGVALIYVFSALIRGAVFIATRARMQAQSMTIGEACRQAMQRTGRLVAVCLLVLLRMIGYTFLAYAVGIVLGLVSAVLTGISTHGMAASAGMHFDRAHLAAMGGFFLVLLVLVAAIVVFLCWIFLRYSVAIPAALEENLPANDAIDRSVELTRHGKGRLLAVYAAVVAVGIVAFAVTLPAQWMLVHAGATAMASIMTRMLIQVFVNVVNTAILVFAGVGVTLCYFDLRVRKEGFGGANASAAPSLAPVPPPAFEGPVEDLPIS
jgi:hypothetical protein